MSSKRGYILVLSSPSGAGKSTLARQLLQDEGLPTPKLSVSVTTRQRRPSEIDGTHYHFIDEVSFLQRRDQGALLEWAEVHGNFYGTPREPVERALSQGHIMLFDIDWQGTEQVRAAMPDDTVTVFVLPPSFEELRARITRRAEDKPDVIEKRLENARDEMTHWRDYDYVITNTDLGEAYEQLRAIYLAEMVRRTRQPGLDDFVGGLISAD
ncbi:MAG: guanylate kinase [Rhizobiales bacterium]|nr:guanylate kinase [Hyphomicrobiales bacterium]MBO6698476.1 guanylate kinase [Hyphomicrobiales bacterium]MBO6735270.1 guanylate kinase [Hyphomicrobiales bacterium]MBO6910922.1 guanylate kinase [Hyphomicrobiales bacterium]MBO6955965.1 guanylate kinase [Hyphomicrobiales bacterium]